MGFFSDLFKKGEDPEPYCTVETLGLVRWSEDDEAWFGEHNGSKFSLAYEWTKTPVPELVDYALEVLNDPKWLADTLQTAKESAKKQYGDFYFSEIDSLSFGGIQFYLHKGKRRIIAELESGKDFRSWRIECSDRLFEGVGFDR